MTTVRILGSRAREQMPGTSITLLAPGFRGALTQQAAGVASGGDHDLPFAGAAAGAEVMLASQLTLNLEARTAPGGLGLRSRSAMVAHPRVIVPRRSGVAYAMLQTDETGASSFVLPASSDDTEAAFPLTIAAQGSTRRVLARAHVAGTAGAGGRSAGGRRPVGALAPPQPARAVHRQTANGCRPTGVRSATARCCCCCTTRSQRRRRHSPTGLATPLSCRCIRRMAAGAWPSRIRRWPAGIDDNLNWLVTHLAQLPGPIDVVAHGRGGLLARAHRRRRPIAAAAGVPGRYA